MKRLKEGQRLDGRWIVRHVMIATKSEGSSLSCISRYASLEIIQCKQHHICGLVMLEIVDDMLFIYYLINFIRVQNMRVLEQEDQKDNAGTGLDWGRLKFHAFSTVSTILGNATSSPDSSVTDKGGQQFSNTKTPNWWSAPSPCIGLLVYFVTRSDSGRKFSPVVAATSLHHPLGPDPAHRQDSPKGGKARLGANSSGRCSVTQFPPLGVGSPYSPMHCGGSPLEFSTGLSPALSLPLPLAFLESVLPGEPSTMTMPARPLQRAILLPVSEACAESFSCGNIDAIAYPFWGGNQPAYCGHPSFMLDCNIDSPPEITILSVKYKVLGISSQAATIVSYDLSTNICPSNPQNTSLDFNLFSYAPSVNNITLFYGCTTTNPVSVPIPNLFNCSDSNKNVLWSPNTGLPNISSNNITCGSEISVTVTQEAFEALLNASVVTEELLRTSVGAGFSVDWEAYNSLCDNCTGSGGRCGSNGDSISTQFVCYTDNGMHPSFFVR
nr:LEAF RUST 10 DISEASE-RESISTANCE LOCUS RECEPTOR-LIKE PROTEIN KINASE-like 2.1 [Ipomoea batatas]